MAILTTYVQLLTAPEALDSFWEYAQATGVLLTSVLVGWPVALVVKPLLSHERFGASNRLRLSVIWSAIFLGGLALVDVVALWFLGRIPDWTAVSPHSTMVFFFGVSALVAFLGVRSELKRFRAYVDKARQHIA